MIALEININGECICVAGVDLDGVLTAIVTYVKSHGDENKFNEEISFNVGGITYASDSSRTHVSWIDKALEVGDEICIKVKQVSQIDEPANREQENAGFIEQQERRAYEQLRQKYNA